MSGRRGSTFAGCAGFHVTFAAAKHRIWSIRLASQQLQAVYSPSPPHAATPTLSWDGGGVAREYIIPAFDPYRPFV